MASNKISKESLVNYIQEQVENLHKLYVLKEQRENIQKEIKVLEEGKKKKDSKYSEKAKEFISKKMSKMADEDKPQDQKVAIAMSMAREKGLKVPAEKKSKNESKEREHDPKAGVRNRGEVVFPAESPKVKDDKDHFPINTQSQARNAIARGNQFSSAPDWYKGSAQELVNAIIKAIKKKYPDMEISKEAKKAKKLNEGFSEKGIMTVQKWIEEFGSREAAVKLMDNILIRMVGFSSSDLPDTATFANGLDAIEEALDEGDYNGALEIAKDTAREMLEDEGFGDM